MIPTLNCLASNTTAALLSPLLQPGRKTLPHTLGKNKVFFTASISVKLHSNSVRPLCFLYCFICTVVIYKSYHRRIIFVTWQKTNFEYPQKGIVPILHQRNWGTERKFQRWHRSLISIEMMELRHLTDAQLLNGGYGCPQFEVRLPISSEASFPCMPCTV